MTEPTQTLDCALPDGLCQPERVRVWEDEFHVLHVSRDEEEHHNVRVRRVFPLSGKADYVSFVGSDGKEVVLLAHPHKLDEESRRCVEEALERMYYVARIQRVDEVTETMGVSHWKVRTDRGYASFEVADRQAHIRILPRGRFLITDVDGNRFEIEDVNRLDARSQALVATEA